MPAHSLHNRIPQAQQVQRTQCMDLFLVFRCQNELTTEHAQHTHKHSDVRLRAQFRSAATALRLSG